ncbi:MAG: ATP-binding cassette domain-containing protein [Cyclobacteriaceae bacterium]|nr:ATP-binding cassette domain-containing protein [Cyclobacteriaceae bacterium]
MIATQGLTHRYHSKNGVLSHEIVFPDLAVERGESFLLLGNSGSGKTTLLHLLGGLLRPLTGKIEIEKIDIASLSETELDRMRGRQIGFVFQRNHLISALTVKNNLLLAPFLAGEKQHEERVDLVLDELGLREKKNAMIFELSQGQAQRVAIARAIINKPSLILADEPTSALDDKNCDQVIELLNKVAMENNAALIVATHDHRLKSRLTKQIIL